VHQIRFRPGFRPGHRWGAHSATSGLLASLKGPIFNGRKNGKGGDKQDSRVRGRIEERRKEERKGRGGGEKDRKKGSRWGEERGNDRPLTHFFGFAPADIFNCFSPLGSRAFWFVTEISPISICRLWVHVVSALTMKAYMWLSTPYCRPVWERIAVYSAIKFASYNARYTWLQYALRSYSNLGA